MIGIRAGVIVGPRAGIAVGVSSDPDAPDVSTAIPGVTRDSSNLNYYPANAAEWTALMTAAGLATGNPASTWTLQNASGNPADTIGSITLTSTMTLYQQSITGLTRKCIRGVDGTANSRLVNSTTAPNPSLTSTLELAYIDIPVAPAVVRDVAFGAANYDLRYNTNGRLRLVSGASADLVNIAASTKMWVALQANITAGTTKVFTEQEKFSGTYVLPTSATIIAFGGQSTAVAAIGYAYAAQFTGTAAELSDAQVKTLLQTLGAAIPWS
jgi:hypothetical protein